MIKRFVTLVAAGMLVIGAGALQAQTSSRGSCSDNGKAACCASKKAAITEAKAVTKDELKSMLTSNEVMVVDARDEDSYSAGHIEGAVNYAAAKLPTDKNAKLVFYCGGTKCPAASRAAKKAIEEGYKNVMVYRGGWAEWSSNS